MMTQMLDVSAHLHQKKHRTSPHHYNNSLKKYNSCRGTLTKKQNQDFSLYRSKRQCLSPASSNEKRTTLSKPFFNKSLSDQLQICLSYREKLDNIEHILQSCKRYSEQYGFFYLTQPMISFNYQSRKLQCWIHPDHRSKKPLHPIGRIRQSQAKRIFYNEIKALLKKLFPTVSQPASCSYIDLLINVRGLKKKNQQKRQYFPHWQVQKGKKPSADYISALKEDNKVIRSPSVTNKFEGVIMENDEECQENSEGSRTMGQGTKGQYPKKTISTLIESIKESLSLGNSHETVEENSRKNLKNLIDSMKVDNSNESVSSRMIMEFESLLRSRETNKEVLLEMVSEEMEKILLN